MSEPLPPFNELQFGHLDASQEAIVDPELLTAGYYDYREAAYGLATGTKWLLLGPKGSGKSAVLETLRLRWQARDDRFLTIWDLAGFPVNDVTQVQMGQSAGASRAQAAWEFLLLLHVVDSLAHDQAVHAPGTFLAMVKGLRAGGYITSDWMASVSRWTAGKFAIDVKVLGLEWTKESPTVTPLEASSYIKTQISKVSTESRHLVALDGLDTFFFETADEWTSLAGLMQALYSLNREFHEMQLNVGVVAAMRSDVLDVLPGPEINKLKPHSVYLDWHAFGIGARNHLWKLLSSKAGVHRPQVTNIVTQYMNTKISIGPHSQLPEYLLDNTRLIPRDAVALMGHLKRFYRGNKQVTEESAKKAVAAYCEEYFVGEIFDNLAGVLPSSKARQLASFKDALRTSPTRFFTLDYVTDELRGELTAVEIKHLLKQMFEVGGIGIRNGKYTDFVFRRASGAGFTARHGFVLHDALTRAWNRPWGQQ